MLRECPSEHKKRNIHSHNRLPSLSFPCIILSFLQRLVLHNATTLGLRRVSARLLCNRRLSLLLIRRKRLIPIKVLVNHPAHTLLAMIPIRLRAIVPKRLLVLDQEREHIARLAARGCKVEAREDTFASGKGLAGLVEGGLHDGVVLGEEVEFDEVADFGDDVLGLEVEPLVFDCAAGCDAVDDAGGRDGFRGCGGQAEESGGSEGDGGGGDHFD